MGYLAKAAAGRVCVTYGFCRIWMVTGRSRCRYDVWRGRCARQGYTVGRPRCFRAPEDGPDRDSHAPVARRGRRDRFMLRRVMAVLALSAAIVGMAVYADAPATPKDDTGVPNDTVIKQATLKRQFQEFEQALLR